jgi:hypothetical protein
MFAGTETTRVTSSAPEEQVYAKIEDGLQDLGSVKISKTGHISIDPAPTLSSFHTVTTVSGRVTKDDDEYVIKIDYDCNPTPTSWIISVVLGLCVLYGIGFGFFLIALLQQSTVKKAIQNALDSAKASVK